MDINRSMRMTVTLYNYPESKNNYLTVVFNQQQIFKGLFKPHDEDAIEVKRNTEQVFQ